VSTASTCSRSGTTPPSATDSKSSIFTDFFSDELFGSGGLPDPGVAQYTSPKLTGSPILKPVQDVDPETLARDDPLAAQVWRMYARTKAPLPQAQRMENLTWRMMALKLKKAPESRLAETRSKEPDKNPPQDKKQESVPSVSDNERGRRIDKGKVRVVGFDGANQDGVEDEECVQFLL
jgi:GATA-binding protein, other eukaryote